MTIRCITAPVNEIALCSLLSRRRWSKRGNETRFDTERILSIVSLSRGLNRGGVGVTLWVPLALETK